MPESTPDWLQTDGYKFSMAQAGWPLRRETFVYTHRKGGWQFLPFDPATEIRKLLPEVAVFEEKDLLWLWSHGYDLGAASRAALQDPQIEVHGLPAGSWFYEREPVFTVTGRSLPTSWLEPLVLRLHYRIQVATAALIDPNKLKQCCAKVATEEERAIVLDTLAAVERLTGRKVPEPALQVATSEYADGVLTRMRALVEVVGDPDRLFEVGMRAATTESQHRFALAACREAGVRRTSNVAAARELGMIPVGTMGHEHVQRFGGDLAAYRAMRDRVPGFVFMLPDTFNTLRSGLPAALTVLRETPGRAMGIRFDSEKAIRWHYHAAVARLRETGIGCRLALEGGWTHGKTVEFETLRERLDVAREDQCYGLGGYIVEPPWACAFRRDGVSAVWKLTRTADLDVMKFGDEASDDGRAKFLRPEFELNDGKKSPPGDPVVVRPALGSGSYVGPVGIIAQRGEYPAREVLTDGGANATVWAARFTPEDIPRLSRMAERQPPIASPATVDAIARCRERRAAVLAEGAQLDERL